MVTIEEIGRLKVQLERELDGLRALEARAMRLGGVLFGERGIPEGKERFSGENPDTGKPWTIAEVLTTLLKEERPLTLDQLLNRALEGGKKFRTANPRQVVYKTLFMHTKEGKLFKRAPGRRWDLR